MGNEENHQAGGMLTGASVGTSVVAFATTLLIFGVVNSFFSGRYAPQDIIFVLAMFYFGISVRKGKRRAMKWGIALCVLYFIIGIIVMVMVMSSLLSGGNGTSSTKTGRLVIFLLEAIIICVWSLVNIVWLYKVLKVTRGTVPDIITKPEIPGGEPIAEKNNSKF